jgi:hypothetical protein
MKKTEEIDKALKRREFVNKEINKAKSSIDQLTRILNSFENEIKILDFELHNWDIFSKKTARAKLKQQFKNKQL